MLKKNSLKNPCTEPLLHVGANLCRAHYTVLYYL